VDERFLSAWYSRRHTVMGVRLLPFSLGHRLTLEALDSPFCHPDRPFTMADLALAVRICAQPPFVPLRAPTWGERVRFWRGVIQPAYFQEESMKFVAYLDDHCCAPRFWNKTDQQFSRQSVPWLLEVAAGLLRTTSMREREVWRMPLGKALWYYAALARQEGVDVDILTTDDEALLDSLEKEVQS